MINKQIVKNKLKNLLAYLDELAPLLLIEDKKLLNKEYYKDLRALEREFQLIVDTMIEINSHLISKLKLEIPDDYTNTFISLGANKILPADFARDLANVVGLRNKIVHKYDIIDQKKFIQDIKSNSGQFMEYINHINNFLEKNGN